MSRLFLAATIAAVAAPAAATDWDSAGGWDVYEIDGTRCAVGRVFADARMSFGLIMSVDGETRVFATGAGWPTRAGQALGAQIAFDGRIVLDRPSVGMESEGNRGFVAAADEALLSGFAGASRLTVRAGDAGPTGTTALTGTALGLAQGRRCVTSLRRERHAPAARVPRTAPPAAVAIAPRPVLGAVPRAVPRAAVASRAVPRASLASWVGDTEYPAAAMRARQEGATTVRITIDRSGGVGGCEVARSSGSPALDEETCRIFKRRGRFTPARDAGGAAIDSVEQQTIRWKLPE